MESGSTVANYECYNCGGRLLAYTEETPKSGWLYCDGCGERGELATDFAAAARNEQERAIRAKLGVDEFLDTRRIHHQPPKGN